MYLNNVPSCDFKCYKILKISFCSVTFSKKKKKYVKCVFGVIFVAYLYIQRVSEISMYIHTLILTSDRSLQEQQNCYVPFFRNIIFISVFYLPINKRAVFFLVIWPNDSDREILIIVFAKSAQNIMFLE
jgi:hypothetical protein